MVEAIYMTLEEFRAITKENPGGFQFKLTCLKCNSENVAMEIDGVAYGGGRGGCDTCSYGSEASATLRVLIKCKSCGNAFNKRCD